MKKVLKLILVLLSILCMLTACKGKDSKKSDDGENSASEKVSESTSDTTTTDLPPDTIVIKVGETQEAEGIIVTLDEVWVSTYQGRYDYLPEGHVYLFPHFTITNQNESSVKDNVFFSTSFGACTGWIGDNRYNSSLKGIIAYEGKTLQMDQDVEYDQTITAMSALIVPDDWEEIKLVVNHGLPAQLLPKINLAFEIKNPE
ncbi:MAG: hypothetical protein GX675_02940 [Erysipelotrichaceae bacterium]|nr:hypothetical protein [Erysipelotrichaceae bacterium]